MLFSVKIRPVSTQFITTTGFTSLLWEYLLTDIMRHANRQSKKKKNTLLSKQEIIYFLQFDVAVLFSLCLPLRQTRFTHNIPHPLYGQINIFD